jgi:hypothetical protein
VRYARRPAALTQSYRSADISTNARRPSRVISIGPQRAYRNNASNSRRNFKIVVTAMAIVRYFDRLHSTPNAADIAAAGNCRSRSLPGWLDSQNQRLWKVHLWMASACKGSGAVFLECSAGLGGPRQLDTNSTECCEFSRTAAAILPKYSASPAGRPTPMTTRS